LNLGAAGSGATAAPDDAAGAPPEPPDRIDRTAEHPLSATNPINSKAISLAVDFIPTSLLNGHQQKLSPDC
jgi:hypothetical protein